jgi:OOP family OmpA-OmpF porin
VQRPQARSRSPATPPGSPRGPSSRSRSPTASSTPTGNETITLPGDDLFDAGRATLRPDGRATLDALADRLHGSPYRSLKVVAHSDRSGAVRTNFKLSWQRARAVRSHLAARGIPRDLIEYEGMGASQARIDPADCRGDHRVRARCLAPDRRVDIIVVRPPAS